MNRKDSSLLLTPERAQKFIAINTHPGQRSLSRAVVTELATKIEDGRFHEGLVAIMHNGDDSLMNGQHQCHAVIQAGRSVHARLHEYWAEKGDTATDVARVFAQYNVDKGRTRGDIGWIYASQIGMAEWPRKCVSLCNTALGWIATGYTPIIKISKDDNASLLKPHIKECEFVYRLLWNVKGQESRHLLRSPVIAAVMLTHRKHHDDAELFWTSVRDGDMLKKDEPAAKLRTVLLRSKVSLGRGAGQRGEQLSQFAMCAKCIHAWNAYRTKGATDLKVYADKPMPEAK